MNRLPPLLTKEQRRALHVKVQDGLACASEIAYPIVLVCARDFLTLSDSDVRSCYLAGVLSLTF